MELRDKRCNLFEVFLVKLNDDDKGLLPSTNDSGFRVGNENRVEANDLGQSPVGRFNDSPAEESGRRDGDFCGTGRTAARADSGGLALKRRHRSRRKAGSGGRFWNWRWRPDGDPGK